MHENGRVNSNAYRINYESLIVAHNSWWKLLKSEFEDLPKLTDAENEAMKVLKNEMDEMRQELEVERNVNVE